MVPEQRTQWRGRQGDTHSRNLETRGLESDSWLVDDEEEDSQVQVEMLRVKAIS